MTVSAVLPAEKGQEYFYYYVSGVRVDPSAMRWLVLDLHHGPQSQGLKSQAALRGLSLRPPRAAVGQSVDVRILSDVGGSPSVSTEAAPPAAQGGYWLTRWPVTLGPDMPEAIAGSDYTQFKAFTDHDMVDWRLAVVSNHVTELLGHTIVPDTTVYLGSTLAPRIGLISLLLLSGRFVFTSMVVSR
jgi:hypothetical protein